MKNLAFILLVLLGHLSFAQADRKGNGGDAVICKNETSGVVQEELFDLYEGRILKQIQYNESSTPYLEQVRTIINNLGQTLGQTASTDGGLIKLLEQNIKNLVFLPLGVGLAPVNDVDSFLLPKNCQIIQAANFRDDDGRIYIDSDVWGKFSETQKAALLLHETIYEYLRKPINVNAVPVEITSNRTRNAVALLISGVHFVNPTDFANPKGNNPLLCETRAAGASEDPSRRTSAFYVYPTTNNEIIFQLIYIGDRSILTRTTLSLKNVDISKWPNLCIETLAASGNVDSLMDSNLSVSVQIWPAKPDHNKIVFRDLDGTFSSENVVCRLLNIKK
jgi:hypothetical protein